MGLSQVTYLTAKAVRPSYCFDKRSEAWKITTSTKGQLDHWPRLKLREHSGTVWIEYYPPLNHMREPKYYPPLLKRTKKKW